MPRQRLESERSERSERSEDRPASCVVCEKAIVEDTDEQDGDESIFCEGLCQGWLHRWCAGLTKAQFAVIGLKEDEQFECARCCLSAQQSEIARLRDSISAISLQLSELTAVVQKQQGSAIAASDRAKAPNLSSDKSADYATAARGAVSDPASEIAATAAQSSSGGVTPLRGEPQVSDRKFNIVVYGIQECSKGTRRLDRTKQDLEGLSSLLRTIDSSIQSQSIRDCFRLGKYRPDQLPRPLLVKLNRAADGQNLLYNRAGLRHPYNIKADLPYEIRKTESILLRERWDLIQDGADKKSIKIRGSKL